MVFKIISTIAVGLIMTTWAFQNSKFINDWLVEKTGIGTTSAEREAARAERLAEETVNTEVTAISGPIIIEKPKES